jgi:hypothetical protein
LELAFGWGGKEGIEVVVVLVAMARRTTYTWGQMVFHGLVWTSAYVLVALMTAFPTLHRALVFLFN